MKTIIEMAREAFIARGFWPNEVCWRDAWLAGAAEEREACAKVCDAEATVEIGCVIVKCQTKKGDWFVLETNEANITLPAKFNEAGHRYVAYQFGKEAMPQIQPYIDKMKEMQA